MAQARIVVVGGGYAGVLAALRVAGKTRGRTEVTLVSASPHFVERIRLHEVTAGRLPPVLPLAGLLRGTGIRLELMPVERIDPARKEIVGTRRIPYDHLLLATGSTINTSGLEDTGHVHTLADVAAAQALGRRAQAIADGGRLVVAGGGLTAIELATELAERHPRLHITMVSGSAIGAGLSPGARAYVGTVLDSLRIERIEGVRVETLETKRVLLADGHSIETDAIAWTAGMRPTELARRSGLAVSETGQLLVDGTLRSISHPDVLGAGDAVAFEDPSGAGIRMACASAMPMGAHAADVLAALVQDRALPAFGFGFLAQCLSLGRRRGVVQLVDAFDRPRNRFWSGRAGATLKEFVCRFTVLALRMERLRPGTYTWPRRHVPLVEARPAETRELTA